MQDAPTIAASFLVFPFCAGSLGPGPSFSSYNHFKATSSSPLILPHSNLSRFYEDLDMVAMTGTRARPCWLAEALQKSLLLVLLLQGDIVILPKGVVFSFLSL